MYPIKLLLVEDDEDDYLIVRDLLEEIDPDQFELDWVSSARQARETLRKNSHHLCFLDYRLGEDNGLQLLKDALSLGFQGPIVMLTGLDDNHFDAQATKAGAVDHLVKSQLNPSRLSRVIRYALARREAERERLQRLQAQAQNRAKSEFLAHLSHELRTPLTAILGYTDLLLAKERTTEDQLALQVIEHNGRHLLSLLNDVLDLSKIEAGKLEIELAPLQLGPFLADIYSLMRVSAQDKRVGLHVSATTLLPDEIETDATRLRQILLNLLGNAIKFTFSGEVELRVGTVTTDDQELMKFEVIDSGIGIEKEQQQRLFEPFIQVKNNCQRNPGTGLGLSISRQLARRLGGDIYCTSQPGTGSTFTVIINPGLLKHRKREPLQLTQTLDRQHRLASTALQGQILVVDDLADIRQLLGQIISQAGANVRYACSGRDAIEQITVHADAIDLVIMDLQMPGLNGLETTQELRRSGFDKPIIALTASTLRGERENCLAQGFNDYLSKPIETPLLLGKIANWLAFRAIAKKNAAARTLLLVEDNGDARRATASLLQHLGWQVIQAANGEEALRNQHSIEVALIDINLPDTDGFQLVAALRENGLQHTRFIALSGAAVDREHAHQAGFDSHLLKPVSLKELSAILPGS